MADAIVGKITGAGRTKSDRRTRFIRRYLSSSCLLPHAPLSAFLISSSRLSILLSAAGRPAARPPARGGAPTGSAACGLEGRGCKLKEARRQGALVGRRHKQGPSFLERVPRSGVYTAVTQLQLCESTCGLAPFRGLQKGQGGRSPPAPTTPPRALHHACRSGEPTSTTGKTSRSRATRPAAAARRSAPSSCRSICRPPPPARRRRARPGRPSVASSGL